MEITPEIQAAIDAAVQEATDKLKTKNSELVSEVRKLNTAKTEAEQAAEQAADDAASKAGDIDALRAQLETKHTKALNTLQAQLDTANSNLSNMLIDDAITKSMVDNSVPAHFHEPLKAMFKNQAKLADGVAMIGDAPLHEYLPGYWKSDAGKSFIPAPVNQGTGAPGVSPAGNSQGYTKESLTLTEFSRLAKDNPANANAIAASVGSTYRA